MTEQEKRRRRREMERRMRARQNSILCLVKAYHIREKSLTWERIWELSRKAVHGIATTTQNWAKVAMQQNNVSPTIQNLPKNWKD